MKNTLSTSKNSLNNRHFKDKQLIINHLIKQVEQGTGLSISELKKQYSEDKLFAIALKHVTTTKKALCTALNIPIEAGCRYKRTLEKEGNLVQSIDEVFCPFTKHKAHLISTNPKEFARLLKSNTNQTKLFE
jgi:DNA-binding transcriptional MerR regulator